MCPPFSEGGVHAIGIIIVCSTIIVLQKWGCNWTAVLIYVDVFIPKVIIDDLMTIVFLSV